MCGAREVGGGLFLSGVGAAAVLLCGGVGWRMASGVWGEYGKALAGQATASVACRLNGWNVMSVWCEMCGAGRGKE